MASFYEELNQKSSYSDEKENEQSRANIDKWIFRLLLLIVSVTPLIVMASIKEVVSPLISNISVLTTGAKGDLFTHFKALFVLIITLIAGALLLTKIFFMEGKIRKTILNYPMIIFAIMIVVSTVASPNISIALHGLYNRSDGAISWLCYIALMFIAMNIEYPKKVMIYFLYSLYPFVIINLFIITMNFYGKDLLQNKLLQKIVAIILPEGASISEGSQLVGTLNQWNYMSGMFAIMTVMFLMAAVLEKKLLKATGHLAIAVMSIAVVLMSISLSGFITVCIVMIVIVLVACKTEDKKRSFIMIAMFILITMPIFHILAIKDSRVWTESIGVVLKSNPYSSEESSVSKNIGKVNVDWLPKVYAAEKFELPELPVRNGGIGSGRLYIWEKTFNVVQERMLLGYGMDTLMYNFTHYNLDARAFMGSEDIIVDKPHNIYMGILYGTGLIGFLSALILIFMLLFKSLKQAVKNNNSSIWILGVAWGAYLIQALFNDSLPGISSTMWVFAGILLAITFENKEPLNERNN